MNHSPLPVVAGIALIAAGCISSRPVPGDPVYDRIRVHIEADPQLQPKEQVEIPLGGGRSIRVYEKPEITEYDIERHSLHKLPDGSSVLELTLTESGREILEGLTSRHVGRRLALVVEGQVVGIMPIEGPVRDGRILLRSGR